MHASLCTIKVDYGMQGGEKLLAEPHNLWLGTHWRGQQMPANSSGSLQIPPIEWSMECKIFQQAVVTKAEFSYRHIPFLCSLSRFGNKKKKKRSLLDMKFCNCTGIVTKKMFCNNND